MLSWNFFRPITLVRAPMFLVFHLICILLLLMKMNICYFIREKLEQRVTPPPLRMSLVSFSIKFGQIRLYQNYQ